MTLTLSVRRLPSQSETEHQDGVLGSAQRCYRAAQRLRVPTFKNETFPKSQMCDSFVLSHKYNRLGNDGSKFYGRSLVQLMLGRGYVDRVLKSIVLPPRGLQTWKTGVRLALVRYEIDG